MPWRTVSPRASEARSDRRRLFVRSRWMSSTSRGEVDPDRSRRRHPRGGRAEAQLQQPRADVVAAGERLDEERAQVPVPELGQPGRECVRDVGTGVAFADHRPVGHVAHRSQHGQLPPQHHGAADQQAVAPRQDVAGVEARLGAHVRPARELRDVAVRHGRDEPVPRADGVGTRVGGEAHGNVTARRAGGRDASSDLEDEGLRSRSEFPDLRPRRGNAKGEQRVKTLSPTGNTEANSAPAGTASGPVELPLLRRTRA